MAKANRRRRIYWALFFVALVLGGSVAALNRATAAANPGAPSRYIRIAKPTPLAVELARLQASGDLRSYRATRFLALLTRHRPTVTIGTYLIGPGLNSRQMLKALARPIHQTVRMPDYFWAKRAALVLAKHNVCSADDYLAEVADPSAFAAVVDFPLPPKSLEGYLFPDSYDFPPLLGAREVVEHQLKAFDRKVYEPLGRPADMNRILTIASLIELEVKYDDERPLVSAVIANRLAKKMKLRIDASVNYALGVWRPLARRELTSAPGPYNLYTHDGLPPGPICSPSLKSIEAAMHPAKAPYLFYVAMPDGHSLFATTPEEHEKNVARRKAALAAQRKSKA